MTSCKKCDEFWMHYKGNCSYKCSKVGKEKILPDWTAHVGMEKIKKAIENNVGCCISLATISRYTHEIEKCLNDTTSDFTKDYKENYI